MRPPVDEQLIRAFAKELGRRARGPVRVYLTGGSTAVLEGWRESTVDVDLRFEPETDELLRELPALKERLGMNIELASPPDFIPELPGWRERSPYLFHEGNVAIHHFDLYSQALSKIERGFDQDLADVHSMLAGRLVEPARLRALHDEIEPYLYRYPAIDPATFRRRLDALLATEPSRPVTGDATGARLRQAVLVAHELEPVAGALQAALGIGEPFRDPGVGEFGLENAVFAVGDCFLEVISPTRADTAAGRYMSRHGGDGGYMAIFDLQDLDGARSRALELGVRVVWQIDLPDISGTHLHPADMRGAIVSLDQSRPYGSWRWGGPPWTAQIGPAGPGRLAGITVAVSDPPAVAARWGQVLGVVAQDGSADADGGEALLRLDRADVRFARAADERAEGLVEIALELEHELPGGAEAIELGGVTLRRV